MPDTEMQRSLARISSCRKRRGEVRKVNVDCKLPGVFGKNKSLYGKEHLCQELIDWLRSKNLSVRQSIDLLSNTKDLINAAWRTEKSKTIL